jgi:hypothetical protein
MATIKMSFENCRKVQIVEELYQIANRSQELECQASNPEHPLNRYGDVRAALTLAGSLAGASCSRLQLELMSANIDAPDDRCWHCETAEERNLQAAKNVVAHLEAERSTPSDDWDKLYAVIDDSYPAATTVLVEKGRSLMEECQRSLYPPEGNWIITRVQEMYESFLAAMAEYME